MNIASRDVSGVRVIGQLVDQARRTLEPAVWDYLSGGAGQEGTLRRNREALDAVGFRRRVLRDVSAIDTSTRLLGEDLRIPVFLAPIGSLGVFHPLGALASARAAARFGTTFFYGVHSETPLDQVARETDLRPVFQLYLRGDRAWWQPIVTAARDLGFRALCITIDLPVTGRRERDIVNGFSALQVLDRPNLVDSSVVSGGNLSRVTWETVAEVAEVSGLPFILKGIQAPQDAERAAQAGAAAIYVSNHGGRQLDGEPATIEILPEIVAAVDGRAKILVDGGFTCGNDIVKAVALGADAVGLGKLHGWSLAAGGEDGVHTMLGIVEAEIRDVMAQIGVTSLAELSPDVLRPLSRVGGDASWIPTAKRKTS